MPTVKKKSGYTALNKKGDLRVIWGQIAISATIRVSGDGTKRNHLQMVRGGISTVNKFNE